MSAYVEHYENGYGMSVCIGMYADGELNVAVRCTETGELVYDTPVTCDTIRCADLDHLLLVREQIKALPKRLTLQEKLEREEGLCTSVAKSDEENAKRIKCILDAWLEGRAMERSPRAGGEWEAFDVLPDDFNSYRYRVV